MGIKGTSRRYSLRKNKSGVYFSFLKFQISSALKINPILYRTYPRKNP
jgi:hypothetical protein